MLPSFCTPPIPSFLPQSGSLNYMGPGKRCKDSERVQSRSPADNTFWVGASDPILSQLRGLRTHSHKQFLDILHAILCSFYACFCALWKLTMNDDRKKYKLDYWTLEVMLHAQISNFKNRNFIECSRASVAS